VNIVTPDDSIYTAEDTIMFVDSTLVETNSIEIIEEMDSLNVDLSIPDFQLNNDSTIHLIIRVFNKQTRERINANISFPKDDYLDSLTISKSIDIPITIKWQDSVVIHVFSDNYLPQKRNVIFDNNRIGIQLKEEFYLDSIEIGKIFQLKNVLFRRGTNELLSDSYEVLDLVIEVLDNHEELNIEIAGHTDNSGNAFLNQRLSEQRAVSIKNYLINAEIEKERITTIGYGGTKPIASNTAEETMKLNRRVEFKLTRK
jgi:outer membrane protein OmpA-like peptidoglycan-associated protein